MCSNWLINGKFCSGGDDLIEAIGIDAARRVNGYYEMVGETGWQSGPNGERIEHVITDAHVAEGCLCHVNLDRMKELTGVEWEYDCDEDAFVPTA